MTIKLVIKAGLIGEPTTAGMVLIDIAMLLIASLIVLISSTKALLLSIILSFCSFKSLLVSVNTSIVFNNSAFYGCDNNLISSFFNPSNL